MLDTPFSPWPCYSDVECQLVASTLQSNRVNYWTGQLCRDFEKSFALFADAQYAVALANGTLALELALKALDIGEGDEVIVTPTSYLASASCVVTCGGVPVFADVDSNTQNLTADSIEKKITPATKAIILVHLGGCPADMDEIVALAESTGVKIIEDCSQAHGAKYNGKSVGSFGDIATWSFCQDKIMTTGGEGGMVTTNDEDLWDFMWSYKDHGKEWKEVYRSDHPPGYRWLHTRFGSNYRMIELQAALGLYQLDQMPEWGRSRRTNAKRIWEAARDAPAIRVPEFSGKIEHAAYRAYVFVRLDQLRSGWSRDRILDEIVKAGVPVYTGSCSEIYREKAFDDTGFRPNLPLPTAQALGDSSLAFLVHPTLTEEEIEKTGDALQKVMYLAGK